MEWGTSQVLKNGLMKQTGKNLWTRNNWVEVGEGRYRKQKSGSIRSGSDRGFVPSEIIDLVCIQELPRN